MPKLKLFTPQEESYFNTPPSLSKEQWIHVINMISDELRKCRSRYSKLGLALQFGYFHYSQKFFSIAKYQDSDLAILKQLLFCADTDFQNYNRALASSHKSLILDITGVTPFSEIKNQLQAETHRLICKQLRPKEIFFRLLEYLSIYNAELASVQQFSDLITQEFITYENELLSKLKTAINQDDAVLLENILEQKDSLLLDLPKLRSPNQSLRPGMIRKIITVFVQIQEVFQQLRPIYTKLNMDKQALKHYASWTLVANNYQLRRFSNKFKKWIYLLSFIHYQYVSRQDFLVDIFLQSIQHMLSKVDKLQAYRYAQNKKQHRATFQKIQEENSRLLHTQKQISFLIKDQSYTDENKLILIESLLEQAVDQRIEEPLFEIDEQNEFYQILHSLYRKIHNRVGNILKVLHFNSATSSTELMEAITYYQHKKMIGKKAPIAFIPKNDLDAHYDEQGNLLGIRYKLTLFMQVAKAIKSGELNLLDSSKYLSIEEYMIEEDYWDHHKLELIKQTGLSLYQEAQGVLNQQIQLLDQQYQHTNKRMLSGDNPFFQSDRKGKIFVQTPATPKASIGAIHQLIKTVTTNRIALIDILMNTQKASSFLHEFQHLNRKNAKKKPSAEDLIAVLMAYGCNIGLVQMASSTKGINQQQLEHVSDWFFSLENIQNANDAVLKSILQLDISEMLVKNIDFIHTASDGQKMSVKSKNKALNARYSYKYFGSGRGISVNSFTDERNLIFHSNVLSSSDRESMYLIDGLVGGNTIQSKWHTTDTEGFTEVIFAVTHLMGIQYAPRIKKYKNQLLYHFRSEENYKESYQEKGYLLLPDKYINVDLIKEQWENILKFVSTIMLRDVTPSQLFKRLNSYSKQHPLYAALKEFGKIIKTRFILQYYDDLELRQTIEYRLNMMELSQKFSKAVFFANNQEIEYESIEEQNLAISCKQLIQNSIILWNYMQLTQLLIDTEDQEEKYKIIEIIKNGTVLTWKHINFYGEYDFSNINAKNMKGFNYEEIAKFKIPTVKTLNTVY